MADNISGATPPPKASSSNAQTTQRAERKEPQQEVRTDQRAQRETKTEQSQVRSQVTVDLSDSVQAAEERALYDAAKVKQLRESIESGNYPIDPKKIAEKFADLERLL